MNLEGKNILFFAPSSFGYEYEIKKELECQGAIVTLYDERPSNSTFVKALIRLNKKVVRFYTNKYFKRVIKDNKASSFDFVFVLRGEAFSPTVMGSFKNQFPKSYFVLYLWDSIKNNNALDIIPYFHKVYSFDRFDTQKHSSLSFLPLFYLREYANLESCMENSINTIMFVGTVHSDRYLFIQRLKMALKGRGISLDTYYFFQSKLLYWKKRLMDSSFKDTSMADFHYESLNKEQLLNRVQLCQAVLDIQHPSQRGLTMRCIETLGAQRKLITTNTDIQNYDFYMPSNILILDRGSVDENLDRIEEFMITPYHQIDSRIYNEYSITSWVNRIFSL